jgi:hypothetical protein
VPLCFVLGYATFYFHGNFLGPRFYFEGLPELAILVAAAATQLRAPGVALALAGLPAGHVLLWRDAQINRQRNDAEIARLVEAAPGDPKLVFVDTSRLSARALWANYPIAMANGDVPGHAARRLFAHDLGDAANRALLEAFPQHRAYRLRIARPWPLEQDQWWSQMTLSLEPITRVQGPDALVIDAPARFPLIERPEGAFAAPVELPSRAFSLRVAALSGAATFRLGPGPSQPGRYQLTVKVAQLDPAAHFALRLDAGPRLPVLATKAEPHDEALGVIETGGHDPIFLEGSGALDLLELRFTPTSEKRSDTRSAYFPAAR